MRLMIKKPLLSLSLAVSVLIISVFSAQAKNGDTNYCNPNYYHCAAQFTVGKDKIAPPTGENKNYCNPNYHNCEAPFTAGNDKIAPVTGENNNYCDPNAHRCDAPFTIGKNKINS